MTEPLSTRLGNLRQEAEEIRKIEKADNDVGKVEDHLWSVSYGKRMVSYETSLGELIREKELRDHITIKSQEFHKQGLLYCVLDLFSPLESYLRRIQKRDESGVLLIDRGVASTLDDPRRDEKQRLADERKNLFCIQGDIFMPGPKRELKSIMAALNITDEGFGCVIARPYGGMSIGLGREDANIPIYYSLLRQIWKITSRHDGEIYCPVPEGLIYSEGFGDKTLKNWTDFMTKEVRADVEFNKLKTYMKITKHIDSRDKLPGLRELGVN